ncbi:MAG: phosphonate C-P lyase system protein PhnH [Actinomycetota bacterium]
MAASTVVEAGFLAAARLDPASSLSVFRALLAAASRPGVVTRIDASRVAEASHRPPAVLLPALALLDLDHVVAVLDETDRDESSPSALLSAATGARPTDDLSDADIVIAMRAATADELLAMRRGSAHEPELGARLVMACRAIATSTEAGDRLGPTWSTVRLRGPGVPEPGRDIAIDGVLDEVFSALAETNRDFPAGIDTWLVADDGAVVAIPRSSTIDVDGGVS